MVTADVVVDAGAQAGHGGQHRVALGGVEVAAAGVTAQGPAGAAVLLPRRQPQRQLEQDGDRVDVCWSRWGGGGDVEVVVGGAQGVGEQGQAIPEPLESSTRALRLPEVVGRLPEVVEGLSPKPKVQSH